MPYKTLPSSPSLAHLKNQARDLHHALQAHELQAFQRVREFHPRFNGEPDRAIQAANLSLSDAQLVIAREYCQPSWMKLRSFVQTDANDSKRPFHERIEDPTFRSAVDLLDAGDESGLRALLAEHPSLVRQKVFFSMNDYFGQPALLDFVAENPIRHRTLPANIVGLARTILEAGAKEDRATIDRTLGLVVSGMVPRECGVQIGLIDLLCDYGADPSSTMGAALGHGEFAAVEALIRRGGIVDLPTAAATGRDSDAQKLMGTSSPEDRQKSSRPVKPIRQN